MVCWFVGLLVDWLVDLSVDCVVLQSLSVVDTSAPHRFMFARAAVAVASVDVSQCSSMSVPESVSMLFVDV